MKILIKSRADIERMAKNGFHENTALISITDRGLEFARLENQPDFLLQVAFDDVDNDSLVDSFNHIPTGEALKELEKQYGMMTDEQAIQIAEFYHSCKDKVNTLICQCEHGQSRSAAVAAAVMEFRSRKGVLIFSHDKYYPNKVVFRKVFEALKECCLKTGELPKESISQ